MLVTMSFLDLDQGSFSEVMRAIREEVMCNDMLSESRIDGTLEKFGNETEVRDRTT